ncbi:hypothetical protein [Methanococcoides sp.]|uniref:hypothetical protein n=1 Tax=Methanococcoides sp. TaxID=1966350 RepID=UPI00272E2AC3|nr:hypothetical protein [Methanococcoides sp.]
MPRDHSIFFEVRVKNPSFDVTPAKYIDLIITGVVAISTAMIFTIIRDYMRLSPI